MLNNVSLTTGLAIWAAMGPIIGIGFGHALTRSWARTQWLRDQRKDEFRELIMTLDDAMRALIERGNVMQDVTSGERLERTRRMSDFYQIVRTRIFTAVDMRKLDVEERWREAVNNYKSDGEGEMFYSHYQSLMDALVKAAMRA